jgi:hypothetical protein
MCRELSEEILLRLQFILLDLGGLVVSVLVTGPKFRGFDPDRGRWIKGDKKFGAPLPSEGK